MGVSDRYGDLRDGVCCRYQRRVLFVPLFPLAFPALGIPLTATEAVQIGLFTEIFGFASSTSAFIRNRIVDYRVAGFALVFAVPSAVAGGVLANVLPATVILVVISIALLLFSFLLYRAPKMKPNRTGGRRYRMCQEPSWSNIATNKGVPTGIDGLMTRCELQS